jgi:hypothetical protein
VIGAAVVGAGVGCAVVGSGVGAGVVGASVVVEMTTVALTGLLVKASSAVKEMVKSPTVKEPFTLSFALRFDSA